jgi:hypothetical protein
VGVTTLKKLCRHHGILRWPFRKVQQLVRIGKLSKVRNPAAQHSLTPCCADKIITSPFLHMCFDKRQLVLIITWGMFSGKSPKGRLYPPPLLPASQWARHTCYVMLLP